MNETNLRPAARPKHTSGVAQVIPSHHAPLPLATTGRVLLLLVLGFCLAAGSASALTMDELLKDSELPPERFMHHFADFKFRLGETVPPPETFLASKAGDCDDFATLAADVLRRKGYTTRLIVVHMEKDVHVVCYVKEIKGYLDYNYRKEADPIVASDGTLADIGGHWRRSSAPTGAPPPSSLT